MKSLRELSDFRVRKEKGYELQQLKVLISLFFQPEQYFSFIINQSTVFFNRLISTAERGLNHLCGSLRISGLENVESKERALEAKPSDKKYLTTLSLAWSRTSSQQPDLEAEVIEGLCPRHSSQS
jgi:hypothetical protein